MIEPRRLSIAHRVDQGRRPSNEDAVVARRLADGRQVVAVADGMGGHAGGEVASRRALDALVAELERGAGLREAVEAANRVVHAEASRNAELAGMGTTVVAVLVSGDRYEIANVGDSRAYRIGPDRIRQLTTDHSFLAEAVRSGRLSREEAERSPWRNALTRAVGTDPVVDVEVVGPFSAAEPHTILLCSDGLYRAVSDEEVLRHVLTISDGDALARTLTERALANGSNDNISVALIRFGDPIAAPAAQGAVPGTGAGATSPGTPAGAAAAPGAGPATASGLAGGAGIGVAARGGQPAREPDRPGPRPAGRNRRWRKSRRPRRLMKYEIVAILFMLLAAVGLAFVLVVI